MSGSAKERLWVWLADLAAHGSSMPPTEDDVEWCVRLAIEAAKESGYLRSVDWGDLHDQGYGDSGFWEIMNER